MQLLYVLIASIFCSPSLSFGEPATAAGRTTYLVAAFEDGQIVKRYLVTLEKSPNRLKLVSEAKPTLILRRMGPAQSDNQIGGSYSLEGNPSPRLPPVYPIELRESSVQLHIMKAGQTQFELTPIDDGSMLPNSDEWFLPFATKRSQYVALKQRIVGKFGDRRTSFGKKHVHSGLDLKGAYGEEIYPISAGKVIFVSYRRSEGTILIAHRLASGSKLYSKYTHIRDAKILPGAIVKATDPIARLMSAKEFKETRFRDNHVHLEIRKNNDDYGVASTHSERLEDLKRHCIDPDDFFRTKLRRGK